MEFVLSDFHRNTHDEEVIDDVKRVAVLCKKGTLSVKDYSEHGKYSYGTVRNRFGSWNEVLRRANLSVEKGRLKNHDYCESDEVFFDDVLQVAKSLGRKYVTIGEYEERGKFAYTQRLKKYKQWGTILMKAGLEQTPYRSGQNLKYSDEELFEEMERIWIKLGRQPKYAEAKSLGIFRITASTFSNHFGSWRKALEAFVAYINAEDECEKDAPTEEKDAKEEIIVKDAEPLLKHKTRRDINLRLRFRVMARDHFKCCKCGKSPATDPTIVLHIDHIFPWAKGGETVMDNLQTLCSDCNLGKSDLII